MLPEPRYVYTREAVLQALASRDCTFVVDTRDGMAMRCDDRPLAPGGEAVDPRAVYEAVSSKWYWTMNNAHKYVWLTSAGGKVFAADRDRRPTTLARIRYQFGRTGEQ